MTVRRTIATACALAAFAAVAPARAEPPAAEPTASNPATELFAHLASNETTAGGEEAGGEQGVAREVIGGGESVERVPMFSTPGLGSRSSSGSLPQRSVSAADQIRQARAQFRARQRMARIEARKWQGYEPLRPHWNAVPMMSSRYTARRVIQVPVYVPAR